MNFKIDVDSRVAVIFSLGLVMGAGIIMVYTASDFALIDGGPNPSAEIVNPEYAGSFPGVGDIESLEVDVRNDGGSGFVVVELLFMDEDEYVLDYQTRRIEMVENGRERIDFELEAPEDTDRIRVEAFSDS